MKTMLASSQRLLHLASLLAIVNGAVGGIVSKTAHEIRELSTKVTADAAQAIARSTVLEPSREWVEAFVGGCRLLRRSAPASKIIL
jgi:hypothetical protein